MTKVKLLYKGHAEVEKDIQLPQTTQKIKMKLIMALSYKRLEQIVDENNAEELDDMCNCFDISIEQPQADKYIE